MLEITLRSRSIRHYCTNQKNDLNLSSVDSVVERVAKNNNRNNGDLLKISKIFLISCFVLVITEVSKAIHISSIAQITANLFTRENTATNYSIVTVLDSVGLIKKYFGHFAFFRIFSSKWPSSGGVMATTQRTWVRGATRKSHFYRLSYRFYPHFRDCEKR